MKIRKFAVTDVALERSPGQEADIFVGNLVDERQGGPITIGYGRYAPGQLAAGARVSRGSALVFGLAAIERALHRFQMEPGRLRVSFAHLPVRRFGDLRRDGKDLASG